MEILACVAGIIIALIIWYCIEEHTLDELCYDMAQKCIWYWIANIRDRRLDSLRTKAVDAIDEFVAKYSTRTPFIDCLLYMRRDDIYKTIHSKCNAYMLIHKAYGKERFSQLTDHLSYYLSLISRSRVNLLKGGLYSCADYLEFYTYNNQNMDEYLQEKFGGEKDEN